MGNWSQCWGGAGRGDKTGKEKASWLWEIWPKELRKYRKEFLISRIYISNEIHSNANEFYSKPNSRAHINTKINASRHECNNQL
jgi:hypothetical protein